MAKTELFLENCGVEKSSLSRKIDLVYCDPPWGQSLVKQFATRSAKKGFPFQEIPIQEILDNIFLMSIRCGAKVVAIEYAKTKAASVQSAASRRGFWLLQEIDVDYKSGQILRPMILMIFVPAIESEYVPVQLKKRTGADVVSREVIEHFKAESVADFCLGLGFVGRAAILAGAKFFYGCEPAKDRFEAAKKKLGAAS